MDRLQISGNVPADIAERQSDVSASRAEVDEETRDEAKEEIVGAILYGKGWNDTGLWHVLQEHLNTEPLIYDTRLREIGKHLQHMLCGDPQDRDAPYADRIQLARSDAETWLKGLVEDYVPEQWIEERAAQIAAEHEQDARELAEALGGAE